MVALAASQLDGQCGHEAGDDLLEGCWQHPEAGLMCPACSITHRLDAELHGWIDERSADVCDVCGKGDVPQRAVGPVPWRPHTTTIRVPMRSLELDAVWPVALCDACAPWHHERHGGE
jgi:hypothetical protein